MTRKGSGVQIPYGPPLSAGQTLLFSIRSVDYGHATAAMSFSYVRHGEHIVDVDGCRWSSVQSSNIVSMNLNRAVAAGNSFCRSVGSVVCVPGTSALAHGGSRRSVVPAQLRRTGEAQEAMYAQRLADLGSRLATPRSIPD